MGGAGEGRQVERPHPSQDAQPDVATLVIVVCEYLNAQHYPSTTHQEGKKEIILGSVPAVGG